MHTINYINTESTWDEALPLGNGHFGAMAYCEEDKLVYAFTDYDVYYKKLAMYSNKNKQYSCEESSVDTSRYKMVSDEALNAHSDISHPAHNNYNNILYPNYRESYGQDRRGRSHPPTGEINFKFNKKFNLMDCYESRLDVEAARHTFTTKDDRESFSLSSIISVSSDVFYASVVQKGETRVIGVEVSLPLRRNFEKTVEYVIHDLHTIYFTGSFYSDGDDKSKYPPFKYIFMVRLVGEGTFNADMTDKGIYANISDAGSEFDIIACVVTQDETEDILTAALAKLDKAQSNKEKILNDHKSYWDSFWDKSSVSIPDKMLENIWYVNIYSLACSSGIGARLYEQACGLNGLWDIKQPSQWGSYWYWDVNIEQSFWPVFTSNHTELGEAFYKALLSYAENARKRAKEFYGMRGMAPDHFEFMMSLWPWCAQFLWWHYKYTNDIVFLKEKAFPIFKDILLFFEDYLKYDEEKNEYYIFPDVSPEQGPVTRNSTISLASLKYLLKAGIQSCDIIGSDQECAIRWEQILHKLPFYATSESAKYNVIIKDSEWASPEQYLAHSSPLMPIYPIGEINKRSRIELKQIALNTLNYVENEQNLGTHNFGWEACAAARLGCGDEAIRILYERGIAFIMRTNGLFAEETERWIQNCLTACVPVYNPPLIESGSSVAAVINEMLLQSYDGLLEVYPALPTGTIKDNSRNLFDEVNDLYNKKYAPWQNCSFNKLLAEGGFEVSASQSGIKTSVVRIRSLAGNKVSIIDPFKGMGFEITCDDAEITYSNVDDIISFPTCIGKTYVLKAKNAKDICIADNLPENMLVYTAPSKRRVFLGKNPDMEFLRALDNFVFDYYQGDIRTSRLTVYKFDFSMQRNELPKDYSQILPKQFHACGKNGLDFIRIDKNIVFNPVSGFGWESTDDLVYEDRKNPDPFRRDFIGSTKPGKFKVELVRGHYQLFISSGDPAEPSFTSISINGQKARITEAIIRAGEFKAYVLPLSMDKDGIMEIELSTLNEYMWKVNMIMINRIS